MSDDGFDGGDGVGDEDGNGDRDRDGTGTADGVEEAVPKEGTEAEHEDWFDRALRESGTDPESDHDSGEAGTIGTPENATGETDLENPTHASDIASGADADTSSDADGTNGTDSNSRGGLDSNSNSDSESNSLFDDDFGAALENVEVPTIDGSDERPAGFSDLDFGFTGPGESNFDEELESALPRIDIGIEGLDRMIQGGIPERSLLVTIGGAGTGKTTFGLQFLNHALENGENTVFITLEETRERVINSAMEKGYPFDEYCEAGQLAVVDMDPVEMANSLASIQSELPRLIEDFGASRLVLDSVSLLEMMYDDRAQRRNEIFGFTQSLKDAGVTAMLTSEAAERTTHASRFGIVEYLTDAVFVLQYVRSDAISETRLAIEIQKIRDANHSRETKPYEITGEGISVYQQANLF